MREWPVVLVVLEQRYVVDGDIRIPRPDVDPGDTRKAGGFVAVRVAGDMPTRPVVELADGDEAGRFEVGADGFEVASGDAAEFRCPLPE